MDDASRDNGIGAPSQEPFTYDEITALRARLEAVTQERDEWSRQALYHNAEHGKLVVIQCETETRAERAEAALARISLAWPNVRDADCSGGDLVASIEEIDAALAAQEGEG